MWIVEFFTWLISLANAENRNNWWVGCPFVLLGGSETKVYQPSPPPAPTTSEAMESYVENMPQMYETQLEYLPQFAQLSKGISEQLYPTTAGLQEQLAGQAVAGMEEPMPDWMRDQYQSDIRANLGTNIGSPIGAEYTSRQMLGAGEDWRRYYQNLGLTAAGRQQLVQAPSIQGAMGGYNFPQVQNAMMSGYGTYARASRPMVIPGQESPWMDMLGQGVGGLAGGIGMGMMMSSIRYKKNVCKWAENG